MTFEVFGFQACWPWLGVGQGVEPEHKFKVSTEEQNPASYLLVQPERSRFNASFLGFGESRPSI
jgi:hypothetical protein